MKPRPASASGICVHKAYVKKTPIVKMGVKGFPSLSKFQARAATFSKREALFIVFLLSNQCI